jgi:hypothetical protein
MKIYWLLLLSIFIVGCEKMHLVYEGNTEKTPIEFLLGHTQCPQCHMEVNSLTDAAQAVLEDGKTYIFDDVGCLILWMRDHNVKDSVVLWVYTRDTKAWIKAQAAYYSLTDTTPMEYGFSAYEKQKKGLIPFQEMQLKMLRGENLANPKIRKQLLSN